MFFKKTSRSESRPPSPAGEGGAFFDPRAVRAIAREVPRRGLLAGMRIRKKLMVLHTLFSLALAGLMLLVLRPAVKDVVTRAELDESILTLEALMPRLARSTPANTATILEGAPSVHDSLATKMRDMAFRSGSAEELLLSVDVTAALLASPGRTLAAEQSVIGACAAGHTPGRDGREGTYYVLRVQIPSARAAVTRVYLLITLALLAAYALVAVALEVFVLPQNVYAPIRRMLRADTAVQTGDQRHELIPEEAIPSDELGEIMRSRNESILKLRAQEAQLGETLTQLEHAAHDLKRKNHLLETAQRNLADADRLASLGMMSAGLAHELNTPLAVLKGLVEKLNADPTAGMPPSDAALMLRVVRRLERLGDGLLDMARVRPPITQRVVVRELIEEAITMVRLDPQTRGPEMLVKIPTKLNLDCDPDRVTQVLVNLLRNAADASGTGTHGGEGANDVTIEASPLRRDERDWISITITDSGPGIDAAVLPRLFEPFVSTKLDARGTGLGLAVSEGIVKEHGGVLLARNRSDRSGAIFEIVLPSTQPAPSPEHAAGPSTTDARAKMLTPLPGAR